MDVLSQEPQAAAWVRRSRTIRHSLSRFGGASIELGQIAKPLSTAKAVALDGRIGHAAGLGPIKETISGGKRKRDDHDPQASASSPARSQPWSLPSTSTKQSLLISDVPSAVPPPCFSDDTPIITKPARAGIVPVGTSAGPLIEDASNTEERGRSSVKGSWATQSSWNPSDPRVKCALVTGESSRSIAASQYSFAAESGHGVSTPEEHGQQAESPPFICGVLGCGKSYSLKPSLRRHARESHTEQEPSICPVCAKQYSQLRVLRRHARREHGLKLDHGARRELHSSSAVPISQDMHCEENESLRNPPLGPSMEADGSGANTTVDSLGVPMPSQGKDLEALQCPHCDKSYNGEHARDIWRRHLQDKHSIPLSVQPRRSCGGGDVNRPKNAEQDGLQRVTQPTASLDTPMGSDIPHFGHHPMGEFARYISAYGQGQKEAIPTTTLGNTRMTYNIPAAHGFLPESHNLVSSQFMNAFGTTAAAGSQEAHLPWMQENELHRAEDGGWLFQRPFPRSFDPSAFEHETSLQRSFYTQHSSTLVAGPSIWRSAPTGFVSSPQSAGLPQGSHADRLAPNAFSASSPGAIAIDARVVYRPGQQAPSQANFASTSFASSSRAPLHPTPSGQQAVNLQPTCSVLGCRKTFKRTDNLRRHIRNLHTERAQCTLVTCEGSRSIAANQPSAALRDYGASTPEEQGQPVEGRPFMCGVLGCGKSFPRERNLKRHIGVMHTEREHFTCPAPSCSKVYSAKQNLRKHAQRKHGLALDDARHALRKAPPELIPVPIGQDMLREDNEIAEECAPLHLEGVDDASNIADSPLSVKETPQANFTIRGDAAPLVCKKCGRSDIKNEHTFQVHQSDHNISFRTTFSDGVVRMVSRKTEQDVWKCRCNVTRLRLDDMRKHIRKCGVAAAEEGRGSP